MHNIHIGVEKENCNRLEELLSDVCYKKLVFYKNVIFEFDKEDWCHPHNPLPAGVLTYLNILGEENYGFVRVNKSLFEVEIHGTPSNFGVEINIGVKII